MYIVSFTFRNSKIFNVNKTYPFVGSRPVNQIFNSVLVSSAHTNITTSINWEQKL